MQNSGLARRKLIYGALAFGGTASLLRLPTSAASTLPPTPRQRPARFTRRVFRRMPTTIWSISPGTRRRLRAASRGLPGAFST